MKKNGILFSLMMLAVMLLNPVQATAQDSIDPQSLVGTWVGEVQNDKDPDSDATYQMQDTEVYNADNSYKSITKLSITQKMNEGGLKADVIVKCTGITRGTWTLKGNQIKYQYDKKQSKLTVDDVVIKAGGITITEPSIVDPVKEEFQKDITTDMLTYPKSAKILSLEGNKMVQEDDGDTTTYTRK